MRRSSLKPEGRAVRAATGAVRWVPSAPCPVHGGEHYTASGRCVECTKLAKEPAKQARYWAANADIINAKRREQRRGRGA